MSSHHVAAILTNAAALAINAGLDTDLSGYGYDENLLDALKSGQVSAAILDKVIPASAPEIL